jgi:hypothetical protein
MGIMLRDTLSAQKKYLANIIEDALSETGAAISKYQKENLMRILNHVVRIPFDPSNAAIPRDTAIELRNELQRLIEQIDGVNTHIRKIVEKNSIFDYGESAATDESEFYHG